MLAIVCSLLNTIGIVDRKLWAHTGGVHVVQVEHLLYVTIHRQDGGLSDAGHHGYHHKAHNILICHFFYIEEVTPLFTKIIYSLVNI